MPQGSIDFLQPNGIDLSIAKIETFRDNGILSTEEKRLPSVKEVLPFSRENDRWFLARGEYLITFNETVQLPDDIMAYILPRSSLLRMGVSIHGAVWDAGYHGQGQSLLVVYNPRGWKVERNARVAQLVFHRLEQSTQHGYAGSYQFEGIPEGLEVDDEGDLSIENPTVSQIHEFIGLVKAINDGSYQVSLPLPATVDIASFDIPEGATVDAVTISEDGGCTVTMVHLDDRAVVTDISFDDACPSEGAEIDVNDPGNPSAHGLCYDRCLYCSDSRDCIHASGEERQQMAEIKALEGKTARVELIMPAEDYPDFKRYQVEDSWEVVKAEFFPTSDGPQTNFDQQVAAMGEAIMGGTLYNRSERALAERYGQLPLTGVSDSETDLKEVR